MDNQELIASATAIAAAATSTIDFALKAINAMTNGDRAAADAYLAQSRDHYARSGAAWDATPAPAPEPAPVPPAEPTA